MGRVATLASLSYFVVVVLLRVSGSRTLAKTAAFDQVVSVAFGSTLATIMLSKGTRLADGATAFLCLIVLQYVVASLILRSKAVQRWAVSAPTAVVQDGVLKPDRMRSARLVEADVHAALRKAGLGRVEDAALVVLESDGTFGVVPADAGRPPTAVAGLEGQLS